jgi:hypothetical protein
MGLSSISGEHDCPQGSGERKGLDTGGSGPFPSSLVGDVPSMHSTEGQSSHNRGEKKVVSGRLSVVSLEIVAARSAPHHYFNQPLTTDH